LTLIILNQDGKKKAGILHFASHEDLIDFLEKEQPIKITKYRKKKKSLRRI
jgi:hypothetical protein